MAKWISAIVSHARKNISFYRDHLSGVTTPNLNDLPTFDKSMITDYGRFAISTGGAEGALKVFATSGTSGRSLYVSFDEKEWSRTGNWLKRVGEQVGLKSTDVLLNMH
jgi:phenylacetate-coenzyme A ligase PaaK-like adenylate-forming protein